MIYIFLAEGFEEIEALTVVDWLRRCGKDVKMIGVEEEIVTGAHGISVACDMIDAYVPLTDSLEMVVLPGGMPGTLNLEKSIAVKDTVRFCAENDLYVAAICAAPTVLGHLGILDGKKATCYPGYESQLGKAILTDAPVVIDGKIITGRSAGVASAFALKLVETLCGAERAKKLYDSLVCG